MVQPCGEGETSPAGGLTSSAGWGTGATLASWSTRRLRGLFIWLLSFAVVTGISTVSSIGLAAGAGLTLRLTTPTPDVEVGQPFIVKLRAMGGQSGMPNGAKLRVPRGVQKRGPSTSFQSNASIVNGRITQQMGITAQWTLRAKYPGDLNIGPGLVTLGNKTYSSRSLLVHVHPQGSLGPKQRRRNNQGNSNPLDPFGFFNIPGFPHMPGLFDDNPQEPQQVLPDTDPALSLPRAPASRIFLRAMLDKHDAVLGEQLALTVYEYARRGSFRAIEVHEPGLADFLQHSMISDGDRRDVHYADVGASIWQVRKIRKVAIFPLRAGRLSIAPMRVTYQSGDFGGTLRRSTKPMSVMIRLAPAAGRPLGFHEGDVGRFTLSSSVQPRAIEQGQAVAVTLTIRGWGNFPGTVNVPGSKLVQWEGPQEKYDISPRAGRMAGWKTFSYLARINKPGKIDLGNIELPYYNPKMRRYATARTRLGSVIVRPSKHQAQLAPEEDVFSKISGPRTMIGSVVRPHGSMTDHWAYWLALVLGPVGVVGVGLGVRLAGRGKRSWTAWRTSTARKARTALDEARDAEKEGNIPEMARAVASAVHRAIEAHTGLKSRGVLRDELEKKLREVGLAAETAKSLTELLDRCETLRYNPDPADEDAGSLLRDADALVRELQSKKKSAGGAKGAS